jgi:dTDP-4-amino-4,6-dideoxygalactose transaminase
MYYILLDDIAKRTALILKLKEYSIQSTFHYIPLHSSPAGKKYALTHGELINTNNLSNRIIRLPLFPELTDDIIDKIVDITTNFLSK